MSHAWMGRYSKPHPWRWDTHGNWSSWLQQGDCYAGKNTAVRKGVESGVGQNLMQVPTPILLNPQTVPTLDPRKPVSSQLVMNVQNLVTFWPGLPQVSCWQVSAGGSFQVTVKHPYTTSFASACPYLLCIHCWPWSILELASPCYETWSGMCLNGKGDHLC